MASAISAVIGQFFELVFFVTLMITMIGLAVGIDYSMFVVSRFREEMNRGRDKVEAAVRSADTAGRTVLFSGITVVIALCGMLIVPASFFQSLGLGAILVVLVAMAATLTLLPAVLALMGPRIDLLPLPYFGRRRGSDGAGRRDGFWEITTRAVTPGSHRELCGGGRAHDRRHPSSTLTLRPASTAPTPSRRERRRGRPSRSWRKNSPSGWLTRPRSRSTGT